MTDAMLSEMRTDLWIGGHWREASDGARINVKNPAAERTLASVASATPDDCIAAVAAPQDALAGWATASPRARGQILRKAYELMVRDGEIPARLITIENGKGLADARGEVAYLETQYISADW